MDVHKDSIEIAIAQGGRNNGKIDGTLEALDKVVWKLVSNGGRLHFVYEAGPCGYQIYRHLTAKGYHCAVVAPSRDPKKSGDRIKNDRRDACTLARLDRAGELTPVYVPRNGFWPFCSEADSAIGKKILEQSPHGLVIGY